MATALFTLGVLSILSVGGALLLCSLVPLAALAKAMRHLDRRRAVLSALSGSAVALGTLVLWLAVAQSPVIACLSGGGVQGSSHYWWGGGPSTGASTGTATPDGATNGTMAQDGVTIRYTCRDGMLVEFQKIDATSPSG